MRVDEHFSKWTPCQACELYSLHVTKALLSGAAPANILFVSAIPGDIVTGSPMAGIPGWFVDQAVHRVMRGTGMNLSYATVSLVACRPDDGMPSKGQLATCRPRVDEVLDLVNPQICVMVGAMPRRFGGLRELPCCEMTWMEEPPNTPATLLKFKREVLMLQTLVIDYVEGTPL